MPIDALQQAILELSRSYPKTLPQPDLNALKQDFASANDLTDLSQHLKNAQEALMNGKSVPVTVDDKKVRVFDGFNGKKPFEVTKNDFYARGLQHAEAAIRLAEWDKKNNKTLALDPEIIKKHLTDYTTKIEKAPSNEAASKATLEFIGELSYHIAEKRTERLQKSATEEDYQKAFKDLKKSTELLNAIEPREDVLCTFNKKEDGQYEIQMSERLKFEQFPNEKVLTFLKMNEWYKENTDKHGGWFENFIKEKKMAMHCLNLLPPVPHAISPILPMLGEIRICLSIKIIMFYMKCHRHA